jgi:hypothetical protein
MHEKDAADLLARHILQRRPGGLDQCIGIGRRATHGAGIGGLDCPHTSGSVRRANRRAMTGSQSP